MVDNPSTPRRRNVECCEETWRMTPDAAKRTNQKVIVHLFELCQFSVNSTQTMLCGRVRSYRQYFVLFSQSNTHNSARMYIYAARVWGSFSLFLSLLIPVVLCVQVPEWNVHRCKRIHPSTNQQHQRQAPPTEARAGAQKKNTRVAQTGTKTNMWKIQCCSTSKYA